MERSDGILYEASFFESPDPYELAAKTQYPYQHGQLSKIYQNYAPEKRKKINEDTNEQFRRVTGFTGKLDPKNPDHKELIWKWFRIRDVVMELKYGARPPSIQECFHCCYKLSANERASIIDQVDKVFAERTGITRKLQQDRPEDRPRIEEWLRIGREIARSIVVKRKPGIVTIIDPALMNAFLSQYEGDSRVPQKATIDYLSNQNLLTMGIVLRDRVVENWSSGKPPITLKQFYDLAFDITNHCGSAMLLCHNVAKAFARGGTAIYWQYNEATGNYEDGKKSYVPKIIHRKGVLRPRAKKQGKSIFYVLFSANEIGTDDPGDWYHYFVNATVAAYSTADEVGSASSSGSLLPNYVDELNSIVNWTSKKMKDSSLNSTNAYKGWLWANALSFLEGAHYGGSQMEVGRESQVHRAGAIFGILRAGGSVDKSWRRHVPKASSVGEYDISAGLVSFNQIVYQIQDTDGNVLWQAAEAGSGSPRDR